jgi:hypothetical protein
MMVFDEITINNTGERFAILVDRFRNLAYLAIRNGDHWETNFDYGKCQTDATVVSQMLDFEGCKKQGYIFVE